MTFIDQLRARVPQDMRNNGGSDDYHLALFPRQGASGGGRLLAADPALGQPHSDAMHGISKKGGFRFVVDDLYAFLCRAGRHRGRTINVIAGRDRGGAMYREAVCVCE